MKKVWGLGALLLSCGVGATQFACSSGVDEGTGVAVPENKMDDLIGSVPVTSKSLDGIGSIGLVYDYGAAGGGGFGGISGVGGAPGIPQGTGGWPPAAAGMFQGSAGSSPGQSQFYPQCTGTLISKSSVLTSRSCAQTFEQTYYGYSKLQFAIGADPTQSARRIDVVAVEYAPVVNNDNGSFYPDVGVLHLGQSITDVAPFPVGLLTDDLVGKQFAAIGYGNSDLRYLSGTRRAGSLALRGTSGLLYPLIFDSFEAFYAYVLGLGYYPGPYYGVASGVAGASTEPELGGAGGGGPIPGTAGAAPIAGFGGGVPVGGGGGDDWYRQYLQQQYDTVTLAPGEAYLGGTASDAQPCGADQGGPIVRKLQGKVSVFGVFSRTPFGGCSSGGIYAGMNAETKAFVDTAAEWTDPCSGFTGNGKCVGTTATRCSTAAEGERRVVKFDCALLNQVCVAPGTTEVACTDK